MKSTEVETIRRVIGLLCSLIDEPHEGEPLPRQSPVRRFVQEYLVADFATDITCEEAWTFFREIVQSGALSPLPKAIFFRQLPALIEATFQARKSHHITRMGRRQRGFRGVGIRMDLPA